MHTFVLRSREQPIHESGDELLDLSCCNVIAAGVSGQVLVNLAGRYRGIEKCTTSVPGQFAYVTQNRGQLNLVSEVGAASRAWVDYPGPLWINAAQRGASYSPDGMTIKFDNSTISQRSLALPPCGASPS